MSNPYLPLVARAAAQYRVPADVLAALLQQESGFNPTARSPAGALGIAQFMPGTASGMGVNPLNPQSAIPGAARYLANALKINHGNLSYALASYNAGQGAVNQYHGIPPYSETQNYVRAILAGRSRFPGLANGQVPLTTGGAPTATPPVSTVPATPAQPIAAAGVTMENPAYQRTLGIQQLIQSNAQNAHIPSINLPLPAFTITQPTMPTAMPTGAPAATPTAAPATPGAAGSPTRYQNLVRPTNGAKLIGFPYQGTHKPGATTPANWESDNAIDIAVPIGTPIYATADGTIGSQIGAMGSGNPYTAGLRVHLATNGNEFYYGHLSRLVVRAGQHVRAGQIIGYSGSANGVQHLHFGARNGNPVTLFGYGRT